jgi:hypothetical protein
MRSQQLTVVSPSYARLSAVLGWSLTLPPRLKSLLPSTVLTTKSLW